MKRGELRDYIRLLADELTEAPEGLFTNAELNLLINISQQNIALALAPHIPWAVTKTFLISITANKREYIIETDFSLTDFFMMDGIFHNESGYERTELLYVERDQLVEYNVIGETGDPKVWSWESMGMIAFDPCPDQAVANKYKGAYIPVFKDLNDDTTQDPVTSKYAIPFNGSSILTPTHPLIALDVLKQWHIRGEEENADIKERYKEIFADVLFTMQQAQGVNWKGRLPVREMIKR
jgi:hypothetical protein